MLNSLFFLSVSGLLSFAVPVYAGDSIDGSESSLPVILITPEWREVDLQQSSTTVDSFSAWQLDSTGVESTQELQYKLPGLVFSSSGVYGNPCLRGVGCTVATGGNPGVVTFIDGVYLSDSMQAMQDFYDVKRVEVIKGPHAVHLGPNVVGGAISIGTEDPGFYTEGYADVQYGSYTRQQLRGAYNIPLSDTLAFRLSATGIQRDGYSQNLFRNEDLDDQDYYAWRGKLRYAPDDDLDVIIGLEQGTQDDTQGLAKYPNPAIGVNGGIIAGGTVPDDPRQVNHNVDENQRLETDLTSIKLNWKIAGLQLRAITSYQQVNSVNIEDLDATEVDFSKSYSVTDTASVSQEFRLSSSRESQLNWVGGVYLYHEDADKYLNAEFPLMVVQNETTSSADNASYAVFGELDYGFAPAWRMRAGLRYSYEERGIDLQQTIADPLNLAGGNSIADVHQQDNWDALTPELEISYQADVDTFYYARAARGFKSGGYNAYSIQPAFDPEYLWAYETGIKTTWPDELVKLNVALFHYVYSDIQLLTLPPAAPLGTTPVVDNAARAQIDGIDIQFWSEPVTRLELTAGATFMDARFKEFVSVDPNNPLDNPGRTGDPLPQAPRVSWILGGAYQWKLAHYGDLRLSVDYRYQSAIYFNPYQDAAVRQQAYGLLGMALSFESYRGDWYVQLYGNNLSNELYAQNIIRVDPVAGTVRLWGEPRTFGLRIGRRL